MKLNLFHAKQPPRKVGGPKSCGAVIVMGKRFLVVRQAEGHWSFPKGPAEEGETEQSTAMRNVLHETGLSLELLEGFRTEIEYPGADGNLKKVAYFCAKPSPGEVVLSYSELSEFAWLGFPEALERITYEETKAVLKQAAAFLKKQKLID